MNGLLWIMEFLISVFDAILCVYFISRFNGMSVSPKKNKYIIPAALVISAFSVINDLFLSGFNIVGTVIFLCLYLLYALLISNKRYISAVLSACVFEIVFILLSSLLYLVITFIIKDYEQLSQGASSIFRYLYVVIHKVLLFAVLKLILVLFKRRDAIDPREGIITLVLSLATVLGLGSTMYLASLSSSARVQTQALIITLSLVLANIALYILIYQAQKSQRDKYELSLLQEKIAFEESRHSEAAAIWSEIRRIQHDMKQHLTVIEGLIDSEEKEKCKKYVRELSLSKGFNTSLISSENKVLDYLINAKLGNIKDTKIIISGSIGDLSDINDTDLVCLMGNILDNAIEAVDKIKRVSEKRIELLFLRQNSNRIIICKNAVDVSVLSDNSELISTKSDKQSHGLGTKIIAKIVNDYGGMVDYFEEFDMFGIQVVLPEHSRASHG